MKMNIPYERWYGAISRRHSRRQFDSSQPISDDAMTALETMCGEFRPFPDARVELVRGEIEHVFRGFVAGYGKVRGAPAFCAVIARKGGSGSEAAGYTGQGIVLEAIALGLDTCWIAMFKKQHASAMLELAGDEAVAAVIPVGHAVESKTFAEKIMTGVARSHQRLPIEKLVTGGLPSDKNGWQYRAIEAARLAPSAVNRQPWGFECGSNSLTVSVRSEGRELTVPKRLDCGIAMMHVELAAGYSGIMGTWQRLKPPRVAVFKASEVQGLS